MDGLDCRADASSGTAGASQEPPCLEWGEGAFAEGSESCVSRLNYW